MLQVSEPLAPKRIDWAASQSDSRETSGETENSERLDIPPRNIFKTPPPKQTSTMGTTTNNVDQRDARSITTRARRVYSIATLMKYRGSIAGISVFAKIKPDALTGMSASPNLPGYLSLCLYTETSESLPFRQWVSSTEAGCE